jgi:hypothetical protein
MKIFLLHASSSIEHNKDINNIQSCLTNVDITKCASKLYEFDGNGNEKQMILAFKTFSYQYDSLPKQNFQDVPVLKLNQFLICR